MKRMKGIKLMPVCITQMTLSSGCAGMWDAVRGPPYLRRPLVWKMGVAQAILTSYCAGIWKTNLDVRVSNNHYLESCENGHRPRECPMLSLSSDCADNVLRWLGSGYLRQPLPRIAWWMWKTDSDATWPRRHLPRNVQEWEKWTRMPLWACPRLWILSSEYVGVWKTYSDAHVG